MSVRRLRWYYGALSLLTIASTARAQEASSGFDLSATLSAESIYSHELTEAPRSGLPLDAAFQATFYPVWKINSNWVISSAVQLHSIPYFSEEYYAPGHHVKGTLNQLNISYSRFWGDRSLLVRVGEMTSVFGSFLARYDAAANPLISMPSAYGYYYQPVSFAGLAGAEVETTLGKLDLRAQLANSSPANPRSVFDHDQYANWAGGAGYTIRQGFRVGGSAYRGPYLDRQFPYFFPGEAAPRTLPATAFGVDVEWGHGPWNVWGEWQHFRMDYKLIPVFTEHTGYAEVRRVLTPRWYMAARAEYVRSNEASALETYEVVAGFRPNRHQILKFGYHVVTGPEVRGTIDNAALIQLVSSVGIFSVAKK